MDEIRLEIPQWWDDCPKFWTNFLEESSLVGSTTETLFNALSEYGIHYVDHSTDYEDGIGELFFKDEASYAWFMLKWG